MSPPHQPTSSPTERRDAPATKRRRPHKKSRNGCIDCRKRRIKCSEERPSCRSCVRREISCQYTKEIQVASQGTPPTLEVPDVSPFSRPSPVACSFPDPSRTLGQTTPASTPGTIFGTPQSSVSAPPYFSIRDLELLHHWVVFTSVDIFKTPGVDLVWQTILPQIGFQHPFVAHAILSLTALHMCYIDGSQDRSYLMEATQHHEIGVAGFHECLNNISEEQSEALLAWSILNLLYVFSVSRQLADSVERNSPRLRKDRLLGVEWIPMMRGIDAVLGPYYDFLRDGRLSTLVDMGNYADLDPDEAVPDAGDLELRRLRELWENSGDAEVYEQALLALRRSRMYTMQFQTMDAQTLQRWGCNRSWSGPLAFVHFAPQEYIALLHQRQPHSLILFAHFGALLHTLDDYWFLEGWGRDIVGVVDEMLGSYWRSWTYLPLQSVGLGEDGNM